MADFKSENKDLRVSNGSAATPAGRPEPVSNEAPMSRLEVARLHLRRPFVAAALLAVVGIAMFVAGYFVLRPAERAPTRNHPVRAAAAPPKPISERMLQAQAGLFPKDEGILTFSRSLDASDAEVRSVIGTYVLPSYGAAEIESAESWGVTGKNHDELVMYVHNFVAAPLTAMVLRISEGSCASFGPKMATSWASAYWGEPLAGGKEAIFHAALPQSYNLPAYCAVVFRVYSSRSP